MDKINKSSYEQKQESFNQQLLRNEQQTDSLRNEKQKINHILSELENDLQQGFRKLSKLIEAQVRYENTDIPQSLYKNEYQSLATLTQIRDAEEKIESVYRDEVRKLDDEREILYEKRSEIPWD